jgi:hypothetical protein
LHFLHSLKFEVVLVLRKYGCVLGEHSEEQWPTNDKNDNIFQQSKSTQMFDK